MVVVVLLLVVVVLLCWWWCCWWCWCWCWCWLHDLRTKLTILPQVWHTASCLLVVMVVVVVNSRSQQAATPRGSRELQIPWVHFVQGRQFSKRNQSKTRPGLICHDKVEHHLEQQFHQLTCTVQTVQVACGFHSPLWM